MMNLEKYIEVKNEVKEALIANIPIVALESTIISHGMPFPKNMEMANECERLIRNNDVIPATIAIINGKIKIGLTNEDLYLLANSNNVEKVSRRDLVNVIAENKTGATTVAATMMIAKMVGIKFFVTGGIGGVHREFNETMDVSADLEELSKTDVNVICAGIKSILDLNKTVEYLETKGIPIIGYKTSELPAFFTRKSGIILNIHKDSIDEIAKYLIIKNDLFISGGTLIVNPIEEKFQLKKEFIDKIIQESLLLAEKNNIKGKLITPFLLKEINNKTGGVSLEANIKLVYNNAIIGSKIAKEYYNLMKNK
ncbi:MAG: pseudouridine-5'-phosphate glycosidase [Bacilli bacterium]|nr:pseudouridine-5'-phosphate glycosidase [Bacilli bacterium]